MKRCVKIKKHFFSLFGLSQNVTTFPVERFVYTVLNRDILGQTVTLSGKICENGVESFCKNTTVTKSLKMLFMRMKFFYSIMFFLYIGLKHTCLGFLDLCFWVQI